MPRYETAPALVRDFPRTSPYLAPYNLKTRKLLGVELPFEVVGDDAVPGNLNDADTLSGMAKQLFRYPDTWAVILLTSTVIGIVLSNRCIALHIRTGGVIASWEWLSPNRDEGRQLVAVGYQRTALLSPEVFQPVSKVLYDKNSCEIYVGHTWQRCPHRKTPVLCEDMESYREMTRRHKDFVIKLYDGTLMFGDLDKEGKIM